MRSDFLLYGATGFMGDAIARLATGYGLRPVLAGRDAARLGTLAADLSAESRVFDLRDADRIEQALGDVAVVLHCAGPYAYTFRPMVEACLRTGTHYLDLTGELPVYEALAACDGEAKARGIMLLPGAGFDVVATDCLAVHLKRRLASATHLTLAFQIEGPAGLPPGTQRTGIDLIPYGTRVRRNARIEHSEHASRTRIIDFGIGPVSAERLTWGDVFTGYYSTGIPNIETYSVWPKPVRRQLDMLNYLRPILKLAPIRNLVKHWVRPGPTPDERRRTSTHVWGEVEDDAGRKAVSRLHGPEAGVVWTAHAALTAVHEALAGNAPPGFQTPGLAYGADFVLKCQGVTREDID